MSAFTGRRRGGKQMPLWMLCVMLGTLSWWAAVLAASCLYFVFTREWPIAWVDDNPIIAVASGVILMAAFYFLLKAQDARDAAEDEEFYKSRLQK